jgi:nicotinate phosphoribosyltransferase
MWEVPLLAVISELVHRYRSPEIGVDQALKRWNISWRLRHHDRWPRYERFRLMDFGTRRRFSREVQQAIVNVCSRSRGLSAPATTIWRAVSFDPNGHPGA